MRRPILGTIAASRSSPQAKTSGFTTRGKAKLNLYTSSHSDIRGLYILVATAAVFCQQLKVIVLGEPNFMNFLTELTFTLLLFVPP